MRVLHIVRKMDHGGVQSMLMNYYRNIDKNKIQFDFLELEGGGSLYQDEIEAMGGHIFRINNATTSLGYFLGFCKFLRFNRPIAIHAHLNFLNAIFLLAAMLFGVQVRISHSHNALEGSRGLKYVIKGFLRLAINFSSTHKYACSKAAANWLYGPQKRDAANYVLIRNAIDISKYTYSGQVREQKKRELGLKDQLIIGHIGHFNAQKNHIFILEIYKKIHAKNSDALLILVGTGEGREEIEGYAKTLKLQEGIIFLGDRNDVPNLLSLFDIFLFPSLHEGLPFALIEAQASGLPCLASDVITNEVLIAKGLHFLSLRDSPDKWANKLLSIDLSRKIENRQILESAGFDIRRAAKELELRYGDAISRPYAID